MDLPPALGKLHMNAQSRTTLLEFPCRFPIKAFGRAEPDFDALVVGLVRQHVQDIRESEVTTRVSREAKWCSVTVTVNASSKEQLDAIYRALSAHEKVVMVL